MNDTNLVLVNLYAPNDLSQQVQFFDRITDKPSKYADENIIIGGDFNCSLTHLDKVEGKPVGKQEICHRQNLQPDKSLFYARRVAGKES